METWDYTHLPLSTISNIEVEFEDNALEVAFDSGRVATFEKNLDVRRRISFTVHTNRAGVRAFESWYSRGGNAKHFLLKNLASLKLGQPALECEYRFTAPAKWEGLNTFDISLEVAEV